MISALKGNRKYHLPGQNDYRLPTANGELGELTPARCGRYVKKAVLESMANIEDDDDQEALFCHRCLDSWNTRNPFG